MVTLDSDLPSWETVRASHTFQTLITGNGMSINIWPRFGYSSLYDKAGLSADDRAVFTACGSTNFEEVLARLAETRQILRATHRRTRWVKRLYGDIRTGLFQAVRDSHVPRAQLPDATLLAVAAHLDCYTKVFTLNYDMLMYWSHMYALGSGSAIDMADFMWGAAQFDPLDTELFAGRTGVYYLHGGLHLWRDRSTGIVGKWTHDGQSILRRIEDEYTVSSGRQPLFISEGTSQSKMRAIRGSDYLSFAHQELADDESNTVVFGTLLGEFDAHIADALKSGQRRVLAFSIHRGGAGSAAIVALKADLTSRFRGHNVVFFDSATHPLGDATFRVP